MEVTGAAGGETVETEGREPQAQVSPGVIARLDWGRLGGRYGLLVTWLVVAGAFALASPDVFLTTSNFQNIFGSQAVLLVLTIGLLFPLAVGELDASVAGVMSLALMIVGALSVDHGWPTGAAVVVALASGVVIGLINALVVVRIGVDSFVATLGMGTLLLGAGLGISGETITGISSSLVDVVRTQVFGLQLAFYYGLILTLAAWYVFRFTPLGRYLYFIGANAEVARLSGLRVGWIRACTFAVSGLVAAFAGVLLAGVLGAADANTAGSYLLPAFAAAFLGATAITPGRFNAWGAFIAVYFLITGITGLQIVGLSGWIEQVFYGGALIVAVTLSQLASRASSKHAIE